MSILFILAIACAFTLSVVVAADLETKDFDGKFKMDVIAGSNFEKEVDGNIVTYTDTDNNVAVLYSEDDVITPDVGDSFFTAFKESSGFNDAGTEGDIHLYEKDGVYAAIILGDGIAVVAMYPDKDTAIDMAKSVEFTK